jgi:hypothetical protein
VSIHSLLLFIRFLVLFCIIPLSMRIYRQILKWNVTRMRPLTYLGLGFFLCSTILQQIVYNGVRSIIRHPDSPTTSKPHRNLATPVWRRIFQCKQFDLANISYKEHIFYFHRNAIKYTSVGLSGCRTIGMSDYRSDPIIYYLL